MGLGLEEIARRARQAGGFPPDIQALIDARAAARRQRDFKRADELRGELMARGYEVKDNRDGSTAYQRR